MNRIFFPTLIAVMLALVTGAALADNVARAWFTTGISDREPVDRLDHVAGDRDRVHFFTELRDLEGRSITHRWIFDGETQAEVPFEIGGPRWRVWSSKALIPAWHGEWTVEIVAEDGSILGDRRIRYGD